MMHRHHSMQLYENLLKAGKVDLVELTLFANTHHECDEHPVYLFKMWHFFRSKPGFTSYHPGHTYWAGSARQTLYPDAHHFFDK